MARGASTVQHILAYSFVVVLIIVQNNNFRKCLLLFVPQNTSVDRVPVMHMQVPHAAINGQSQKHAAKLAKTAASTIGSDQGLDTIKAGYTSTSDKQIGVGSGQAAVSDGQKVSISGQAGQGAANVIPDGFSKTSKPSMDAQTAVKKKTRKGRKQRASTQNLTGDKVSAAAPTSNINRQEVAPALNNTGSNTKRSTKKGKATQKTTHAQPNPPAAKTAGMQSECMAPTDASSCCSCCALLQVKALNAMSCSLHAHVNAFTLMMTI